MNFKYFLPPLLTTAQATQVLRPHINTADIQLQNVHWKSPHNIFSSTSCPTPLATIPRITLEIENNTETGRNFVFSNNKQSSSEEGAQLVAVIDSLVRQQRELANRMLKSKNGLVKYLKAAAVLSHYTHQSRAEDTPNYPPLSQVMEKFSAPFSLPLFRGKWASPELLKKALQVQEQALLSLQRHDLIDQKTADQLNEVGYALIFTPEDSRVHLPATCSGGPDHSPNFINERPREYPGIFYVLPPNEEFPPLVVSPKDAAPIHELNSMIAHTSEKHIQHLKRNGIPIPLPLPNSAQEGELILNNRQNNFTLKRIQWIGNDPNIPPSFFVEIEPKALPKGQINPFSKPVRNKVNRAKRKR